MLTSNLNEHSNLSDIVAQVRKKVNRLLLTYFALIASVILLSLALFSAVIIILSNAFESGRGFDIRVIIIMLCLCFPWRVFFICSTHYSRCLKAGRQRGVR